MAEILPKDRRGQILLLLTIAALTTGYVLYGGFTPLSIKGITAYNASRDTMKARIDSIETLVRRSKADVQHGTVQVLEERLAQYRANLDLLRQLVPASSEMPNLLDDITSRAKMRGAKVAAWNPQPVESGSPFDTQKSTFTVLGLYDQVGEFLSDISSLPRIIVPYNVKLLRATGPTLDTARNRALLAATFQIRTFVKPSVAPDTAAAAGAVAHPAAPARPGAGGGHE